MFRKTLWRNAVNDVVRRNQEQVENTTILLLKEFGPTGFLLKEEGESKAFKVCLGDPHTCNCCSFLKEKDLCKHICWVLMKKFQLPRDHEYCFQLGLVDRQIAEVLQGHHRKRTPRPATVSTQAPAIDPDMGDGGVRQKVVGDKDVCLICQEALMRKRLPVVYCRFGWGNNVHISCMMVWASHQMASEAVTMVKCPLCREEFGSVQELREQERNAARLFTAAEREGLDQHLGVHCNSCLACPIVGKCFKCTVCGFYHLCEDCWGKSYHSGHGLAVRMKRTQPWQLSGESTHQKASKTQESRSQPSDEQIRVCVNLCDPVPYEVLKSLLAVRVKKGSTLLEPGQHCRLCLKRFRLGQVVQNLPCRHKFHADCMDSQVQ